MTLTGTVTFLPTRPELDDARRRLNKALNEASTDSVLRELAAAALGIKKRVRHDFVCKSCNKPQSQYVEISDPVGAAAAFEKLANQSMGRPQEEQNDSGVTVVYKVILGEDPEEDEIGLG